MNLRLKHCPFVLLIAAGTFLSCSKAKMPQPNRFPTSTPSSPRPGQEFLFDSLTWTFFDGSFDVGVDHLYLKTAPRADVFPWLTYQASINAQVSLKFDTATSWVNVKSADLYVPSSTVQFIYWIHSHSLFVDMLPLNHQLIGRMASIKIKFL